MQQTNIHPTISAEDRRHRVRWAQEIASTPGLYSDRIISRARQVLVDTKHALGDYSFLVEKDLHRLEQAASVRIDRVTRGSDEEEA